MTASRLVDRFRAHQARSAGIMGGERARLANRRAPTSFTFNLSGRCFTALVSRGANAISSEFCRETKGRAFESIDEALCLGATRDTP